MTEPPPSTRPFDSAIQNITKYIFHYQIPESTSTNTTTNDKNDSTSVKGGDTVWTAARIALLDTIGCAIETASKSPEALRLLGPILPNPPVVPNGFKVPGTAWQVDPIKGAFDMGVLIRYLDHNDALGGREWGHPSDNLAAILAVSDWLSRSSSSTSSSGKETAEETPPLTIRTLLTALIKAYEIQGCYQINNAFNSYGIDHVILVKLASAALVSYILGLTESQTNATISQCWMDGSHPLRVYRSPGTTVARKGWAAADASMRAVHLALVTRDGQEGVPEALTARPWGFLARTFGVERGFSLPRKFGTWTVRNVLFKIMPVEGHGIAAVEAALIQRKRLLERGGDVMSERIVRIDLRTTAAADLIINKTGKLHNAADRDHCVQYVVALALLKGSSPEVQDYADHSPWATSWVLDELRGKVMVRPDADLTADYLDLDKKSIAAGLTMYLDDGSVLDEVLVEFPIGHVRNPATARAVGDKFKRNMQHMFSLREIQNIVQAVEQDDLPIREFVDLLHRPSKREAKM